MKLSRLPILSGYFLIIVLTASIGYAYYNEERTLSTMDKKNRSATRLRLEINNLNLKFSSLSLMGETAVRWTDLEKEQYNRQRKDIDSILRNFSWIFISETENIDSLRVLLKNKEELLCQLMEVYLQQKLNDEISSKHQIIFKSDQETIQKPKRKGFLGIFGKKEATTQTDSKTQILNHRNSIKTDNTDKSKRLKKYADSLSNQSRNLNLRLQYLINHLDKTAQQNLQLREQEISDTREESYRDISLLTTLTLLMLLLSYVIIHYDMLCRERDRRRLEESVRQNSSLLEMRKKIILTISHDIRGPLNVISGCAELAIDTREKKKRDSFLNNARHLCLHVVHLLNNLLDVYRLNEAKETPNNVPFRLRSFLDRIAMGAAQIINDKGLIFIHDFRNVDVTVKGDEDRIEQIADNLLSNAVKFTTSGTVGLNAEFKDGKLEIEVSDTGIGMSEETMKRIFIPFERTDNGVHAEGFGLGLSITKGQVALLGGTIDVVSEVGKGSNFRVVLPLSPADDRELSDSSVPESRHEMRLPRKVMVIDDDPMQREIVREMLERNSVSCTVCATASDVVRALRSDNHDVLLTDINMPGTNGFALLELLRRSHIGNSRTIPVIAMTARDDDENKPLLGQGFSGCIFKPFSMQELLERVSSVSARSRTGIYGVMDFSPVTDGSDDRLGLLRTLSESTRNDISTLKDAADKCDRKAMRDVLHRIRPVWQLLRIDAELIPLADAVKSSNATCRKLKSLTDSLCMAMERLANNIQDEMEAITYEEQDTDSRG